MKKPTTRVFILGASAAVGVLALASYLLLVYHDQNATQQEVVKKSMESQLLSSKPTHVVLPETAIGAGKTIKTADGTCTVHVLAVKNNKVSLVVTIGTDVHPFDKNPVGRRLVIAVDNSVYSVDLLRTHGSVVDLTINKY